MEALVSVAIEDENEADAVVKTDAVPSNLVIRALSDPLCKANEALALVSVTIEDENEALATTNALAVLSKLVTRDEIDALVVLNELVRT